MKKCRKKPEHQSCTTHPKETGDTCQYGPIRKRTRYSFSTDSELPGENLETQLGRSNRDSKNPNRYGSIPYTGNFWG